MSPPAPLEGPSPTLPWVTVDRARVGASEFSLTQQGAHWAVRVDGRVLMANSVSDSEVALAEEAIARAQGLQRVLVGGLGLGYTLRAVLDNVPASTQVTVAELVPQLVAWNRLHLGAFNDHPLEDARCTVVVGDVCDLLKRSRRTFDVILLDVDNGPASLAHASNQRLYGEGGVRTCYDALTPGGVLGVWSAEPNARYEKKLRALPFDVEVLKVPARIGSHGRHVLFLAVRGG